MRKRLFSVFGVFCLMLLFIGMMVTPVFAYTPPPLNPPVFDASYPPILFDYVYCSDLPLVTPWPFVSSRSEAYSEYFSLSNGTFTGTVGQNQNGDLEGDFYFPNLSRSDREFTLVLQSVGSHVLEFDRDFFFIGSNDLIGPTSVRVRCNLIRMGVDGTLVQASSVEAGGTYTVPSGATSVDLMEAVYYCLGSPPSSSLLIQNLQVEIVWPSNFTASSGFSVEASGSGSPGSASGSIVSWINNHNIGVYRGDLANVADTIRLMVESYLKIEMFPNLTINAFMFLVLTVLIVFAIIRAMR